LGENHTVRALELDTRCPSLRRKRELKAESGETIPAVTLAVQYLGMAVQAIAQHPEYLDPKLIDEKLLLGRKNI
jgi:hypothetical protein